LDILQAIQDAEAAVADATQNPRGVLYVGAPLGVGRRLLAPYVPDFKAAYPQIDLRLRLSDRIIDVTAEGLDMVLHLGRLDDSALKMRVIAECPRVLCAAPSYLARRGMPEDGTALVRDAHDCLNLRFPGAKEFQWSLLTSDGEQKFDISGPFETDDGDVLTQWALDGHGIIQKPVFEVAPHLRSGALIRVAEATPPLPVTLCLLTPHRRLRDPKVRLFSDFITQRCKSALENLMRGL
ncbi:MAG: substrate binding domain-containing protein, partial [Pararhodobacter sp.]|nr:substrate binding domain-containing protein [Pararhodobacter sp.]